MSEPIQRLSRRAFLERLGLATAAASALSLGVLPGCSRPLGSQLGHKRLDPLDRDRRRRLTDDEFRLCEAAQDRLLPEEDGTPGARTVNAAAWLDASLVTVHLDTDEAERIVAGLGDLDRLARAEEGKGFLDLDLAARDVVLHAFANTPSGRQWIVTVLPLTLEAYLGAPSWGGNPGGVVWESLGMRAPYPLPPEPPKPSPAPKEEA